MYEFSARLARNKGIVEIVVTISTKSWDECTSIPELQT